MNSCLQSVKRALIKKCIGKVLNNFLIFLNAPEKNEIKNLETDIELFICCDKTGQDLLSSLS